MILRRQTLNNLKIEHCNLTKLDTGENSIGCGHKDRALRQELDRLGRRQETKQRVTGSKTDIQQKKVMTGKCL